MVYTVCVCVSVDVCVCVCVCVCVVSLVVRRGQKTVRTGHQRTAPWTSSIRNWYKQCKVTSNVWSGVQGVHVCLMMQKARTRSLIAVDAFRLELAAVAVFVSVNHHMHCTVFCGFVLTAGKTHARTHSTTRVTTYTCYTFYCHNTGNDLQDFKFSVFLNNSVTLTRHRPSP